MLQVLSICTRPWATKYNEVGLLMDNVLQQAIKIDDIKWEAAGSR